MTNRSWQSRILPRIFHLIIILCSLALLASIASPEDDAVQHEAAPCRPRHVVRLSKASRSTPPLSRSLPARAAAVVGLPFEPARHVRITSESILLRNETHTRQARDRAPPCFLL